MTGLGLHGKLAQIRGELNGQIVKSGEHTQGGPQYKFVEALEVGRLFIEKASALLITMLPEHMEILSIVPSMTGKQHVVTIGVLWAITDAESNEIVHVYSIGQGADNSDKAAPKAQTNAMKYGILMVLQAAGDDPEKDEPEAPYKAKARRTATRRNARPSTDEPEEAEDGSETPRRRVSRRKVESGVEFGRGEINRTDPDPKPGVAMATADFKAKIRALQHEVGLDDKQFKALGMHFTGKDSSRDWTEADAERVLAKLDDASVIELFSEVKGVYEPEAGGD